MVAPLGQALQDARQAASLSVDDVAHQLNLGAQTVRDIENDLDRKMAKEFIQSQKSRIFNTWDSIKCFDVLFPEGQLTMEFSK